MNYFPTFKEHNNSKNQLLFLSKKSIITFEEAFSGVLFGLVAPVKEYQLSWHLNRVLKFDLKRRDDLEIIDRKKNKTSSFSFYHHEDDIDKWQVFVLSNKYRGEFLVPDIKQADYLLMIRGEVSEVQAEEIYSKLKSIPVIYLVVKMDYEKLKSKRNLMVE